MKHIWSYRFEICISLSGLILLGSVFFPDLMPHGLYVCMLILFLLSILLLKLSNINEHMKSKIRRGGKFL